MSLEEGFAGEELDENAADREHVARVRPAEAKNNLGRAVMSGRDDGRMILPLECRRAKVDQSDVGVVQYQLLLVRRGLNDNTMEARGSVSAIEQR